MKSYLSNRHFQIKYQEELSSFHPIKSGVPQGSVLGPVLYLIYTYDLPTNENTTTATFADDTAILAVHEDPLQASLNLQEHLNQLEQWLQRWRIQANASKSKNIIFTLSKKECPKVQLNNVYLAQVSCIKYLGFHMDKRLTWRNHLSAKKKEAQIRFSQLSWLINRHSKLSLNNKVLLYKAIIRPIWSYGIQLWGSASKSNIEILRRFESKCIRRLANAPWYVTNDTLRRDLKIPTIYEEITQRSTTYQERLAKHPNPSAINLLDNSEEEHRLKRYHILELPFRFKQPT